MAISIKKKEEALGILKDYHGRNPYILMLKKQIFVENKTEAAGDFQLEYVLRNHDFTPIPVNRVIKIADWYGEKKQMDWETEFVPKKLKVISMIGESDTTYHCYVQYRQSVDPCMCFLPKKAVLTNFLLPDYHDVQIDFDRYDQLSMAKDPNRRLRPHQKEAVQFLTSRKKCILAHDMGLGKLEPVSSLIPTPNGYVRMGDINIGDKVFGNDGKIHNVTGTFPHKDKEIYRVTFSDGTYADCGLDHLWVVRDSNMRIRKKGWAVKSLGELIKSGIHYKDEERIKNCLNPRNKFEVPVCNPVEYPEKEYFIHPYILGICIGDGNLCSGGTVVSCPDFDYENIERAEGLLNENYEFHKDASPSCPAYRICLKKENNTHHNEYNIEIKRLGLNVKGNYKFIPDCYKFGSIDQRIDLLRGLMDTDGTITSKNNKISYSTKSERLANDVAELVYSLGGTARVHSYDRTKEDKGIEYMVSIQIKVNPFYLKRKAERYSPTFKKYCTKYIANVEYNRNEDAQCISVDSPDSTYLTGNRYIVTHNTTTLSVSAHYGNFDSVLIICPASLKTNWRDELMWYVNEKDITVVDGFNDKKKSELETYLGYCVGKSGKSKDELMAEAKEAGKWKDNHYVIVNYDILDEFYKIPVTRSAANIQAAYDNSPMLQYLKNKKSLIIIDEAHKLSNAKSDRYKVLKDLINRAKPDSIYLSTGTPITNNAQNLYCVLKFLDDPITDDWQYYMERYCGAKQIPKKGERDFWFNEYLRRVGKVSWHDLTTQQKDAFKDFFWDHCKKITVMDGSTNLEELRDRVSHIYLRRTKEDLTSLPEKNVHEVYYDLTYEQRQTYDRLWLEYETEQSKIDPTKELNKDLLEGAIYRKYISDIMVPNTIKMVDDIISKGEKCIIITCFDDELYTLRDYYADKCVIYNGKMSGKQKDAAKDKFLTDENTKVFIGNVISAGVGLTLTVCKYMVFNSFSFVPSDNRQAEDRIYRISQTRDVDIYYQIFRKTQFQHMWDVVLRKELIIDKVIKKEDEKKQ